ncbi:AAA family ATPase [Proteus appendicitidis]|uniref:ATP-binding protein n=1 Tax=Proteus appendicitidis TaxID=3034648 RepID=A0ABY8Y7P6_9GAMM|nr:ATP-binding protein [Proteus sp. HZ0627]MBG6027827.1 AAA family ATPase [Proteus mirabilis]MBG6047243.1 AAA family ATPase [Proteus mirabilis]WIV87996.1 ATP-binding protein [Proteus sp. HZ0627]
MITRIYIDNFKSLLDFELHLSPFTCLIGLNGAGKSTVLQAMDFSSALMLGKVKKWLDERRWTPKELNSGLVARKNIQIHIDLVINHINYRWQASFNRQMLCCTNEQLFKVEDNGNLETLFLLKDGRYSVNNRQDTVSFEYEGSILSQLKDEILGKEIKIIKERLCALRSLDLLSPQSLRQKVRKTERQDIGMGGEQLSAFLHQLKADQKELLIKQLQEYYPQITEIKTSVQRSGWIQLKINEKFIVDGKEISLTTEARHINDGMLRLLAILAQQFSDLETLLFDEIENGINPEITEKIVDALVASPKQIIVTTHSPMVLNYLEDDVAKKAVVLIYRRKNGEVGAVKFFDLTSANKKLDTLAPGDAMLDLYLTDMAKEADSLLGK